MLRRADHATANLPSGWSLTTLPADRRNTSASAPTSGSAGVVTRVERLGAGEQCGPVALRVVVDPRPLVAGPEDHQQRAVGADGTIKRLDDTGRSAADRSNRPQRDMHHQHITPTHPQRVQVSDDRGHVHVAILPLVDRAGFGHWRRPRRRPTTYDTRDPCADQNPDDPPPPRSPSRTDRRRKELKPAFSAPGSAHHAGLLSGWFRPVSGFTPRDGDGVPDVAGFVATRTVVVIVAPRLDGDGDG